MSKKIRRKSVPKIDTGTVTSEIDVPVASDVVYRHVWHLKKFQKLVSRRDTLDSPILKCILNGTKTYWNIAIRFWKAPNGKVVKNPVVVCLNLVKCNITKPGQARIKYQFGVWDKDAKRYECCPINRVALNLQTNNDLLSIGYINLNLLKRHLDADALKIMLKLQIIQTEEDVNSLSNHMKQFIFIDNPLIPYDTLVSYCGKNESTLKAHKLIICIRSPILAAEIKENITYEPDPFIRNILDLSELPYDITREIILYIYTDKVENLEANAGRLLPVAVRYALIGLKNICERTLMDNINVENVANLLLLADECGCDLLKKFALNYCEDNMSLKDSLPIKKTLAWKVMELVNPELYVEACESICNSVSNFDENFKI